MNTQFLSWLMLPLLVLSAGCPNGGGDGGFEGTGTSAIVYVANSGSNNVLGYTINGATGALTAVTGAPFSVVTPPSAIAVSSNGSFAYVTLNQALNNVRAFTVNAATGALTQVGGSPFQAGANPTAVTVSPNRQFLFVTNGGSDNVSAFTIDGTTGALTSTGTGTLPANANPSGVAVSPNGRFSLCGE